MNFRNLSFTSAALLLVFPLTTGNLLAQVAQPGQFDPQTQSAHENAAADPAAAASRGPLQSGVTSQAVARPGRVIVPTSSVVNPQDKGVRAHTNHLVFAHEGTSPLAAGPNFVVSSNLSAAASVTPSYTFAENPGSLGCVYQVGPTYAGCTPAGGFGKHPVGGGGAIAIVDAYHNPYAATDLAYFSAYWGLPAATFYQIKCQPYPGTCSTSTAAPPSDKGWGLEEALDIEWAHAMAPNAKIFLVEAASNSYADLTWAEAWAAYYVDINGGGEVSNSWGGGEFASETSYDQYFNNYFGNYFPVVYVTSGGDSGTVEYPSASPFTVSAGGTTVNRDASGNYLNQTCWTGTGRGPSVYEPRPAFQNAVASIVGTKRGTTDFSFDANPASGVWVYDAFNGGWFTVGGTSVSAPALAGIINNAANLMPTTLAEENLLYSEYVGKKTYAADFIDVSPINYDYCTGIGTPKTLIGK